MIRSAPEHPFAGLPSPVEDARKAIREAGIDDPEQIDRVLAAARRADVALDARRAVIDPDAAEKWVREREMDVRAIERRARMARFAEREPVDPKVYAERLARWQAVYRAKQAEMEAAGEDQGASIIGTCAAAADRAVPDLSEGTY